MLGCSSVAIRDEEENHLASAATSTGQGIHLIISHLSTVLVHANICQLIVLHKF